jgi:PAS domain S-box-containing protein
MTVGRRRIPIDKRRRSENAGESSILEAALDAVVTADHEGRILAFNKAAERIFGYERAAVIGRPLAETIVPPRDRARHEAGFRRYVATREAHIIGRRIEMTALRADGSEFPVELSITCESVGPSGGKPRFTAFIRDITEAKRAEHSLRDSETRFRALIENATDLITLIRPDATIQYQAPSIELLGYTPAELIGRNALELIHPDDLGTAIAALATVAAGPGATAAAEYRFRHKDGSWRVLSSTGRNAIDVPGVDGIVINSHDISQQKEAEATRARLVAILDATPDFVGIATPGRQVLYVNRSGRRMLGIGPDEDLSRLTTPALHSGSAGRFINDIALPIAIRDGLWTGESVLLSRTGARIPVSQVIIAHRDAAGRVAYFSTICRDITESQRASEAQQRLLNALDKSPEGYALFDPDDRLVFANSEYLRLMRESAHLLVVGRKYEDILRAAVAAGDVPEAIGREEEWIEARLRRRRSDSTPFEVQRGSDRRWLRVREHVLPDGSIFIVRTDITAEKLRDAQLVQAQKMEVVGQLTGGVAHDFNNLLAVIQGNLELLAEYGQKDQTVAKFVAPALRAAQRGGELTQRLLAFSRRQMLRPEIIDLNTLVLDTSELLRRTLGVTVAIETDLSPQPCLALVDANQLENALLNLALNARDAMPQGGRLTMVTRTIELRDGEFGASDEVAPGAYATLIVRDTGRGMTAEILDRVYEPFFTTKSSGSGLGLSMVYGFIKQTGGHITIESKIDGGTTVALYLPSVAAAPGAHLLETDRRAMPAGSGESILVVEDDDEVRALVVQQLARLGYRVQQTNSAAAALDMLSRAEDVDLLLTDILLPGGMTGVGLIKAVRARHPNLRILCMSGFAQRAFADEDLAALDATLLNKPFRHADLARAVRTTLDNR